jgi:hypothetical protein
MACSVLLNTATSSYFDNTVPTRDLIKNAWMMVMPWGVRATCRENADYAAGGQGAYPIWGALGMSPTDWRIGATFTQATSWDALELTLDNKRFRATRGEPAHDGPAPAYYVSTATGSFGSYCGWTGPAPTLSDPAGADQGGALFTSDSTFLFQMAFMGNPGHYSAGGITNTSVNPWTWNGTPSAAAILAAAASDPQKVWCEIVVTGGSLELLVCKENGADPIYVRDISPGAAPFILPVPLGYIMLRRKSGQSPKLVSYRTFVKGVDITGFAWVLPMRMPQTTTLTIAATPGMALSMSSALNGANTYNSTTGAGQMSITGLNQSSEYRDNSFRLTAFNGGRMIPAGGYQLSVTVPEDSFWGTAAEYGIWTKPWIEDHKQFSGNGVRTLDWSTRAMQRVGHHCRVPASAIPSIGQCFEGGVGPETLVDMTKRIIGTALWHVVPHACSTDYIVQAILRADTARGASTSLFAILNELANEIWHNKFGVWHIGNIEGPAGAEGWYGERLHDIVDGLDAALPTWRQRNIHLVVAWATWGSKSSLDAIMGRKRGGVPLIRRIAGNVKYAVAPYYAGGVGGEAGNITFQKIVDACVTAGVNPLTDGPGTTGVIHSLFTSARALTVADAQAKLTMLREWCMEQGGGFNDAAMAAYETNQHLQTDGREVSYAGVSDTVDHARWTTFAATVEAYQLGSQEADNARQHVAALAALGFDTVCFYNGPTSLFPGVWRANTYWGLSQIQGEMPRRPKYAALAAGNAVIKSSNETEAAAIAAKVPRARRRRAGW